MNVPRLIGNVVGTGLATLHELQTVYSLRDAYDLVEIARVDAYNERVAQAIAAQKEENG